MSQTASNETVVKKTSLQAGAVTVLVCGAIVITLGMGVVHLISIHVITNHEVTAHELAQDQVHLGPVDLTPGIWITG